MNAHKGPDMKNYKTTIKLRLDTALVKRGLITTRSQAEQEIEFGNVAVNGKIITKSSYLIGLEDKVRLIKKNPYVSRAGLKLASVSKKLNIEFKSKVVLDVGSSTGGFTDFALQHGAKKVIAVDVGTNQMHPKLRLNKRIELHEQTDIRDFKTNEHIDVVLIDVSFISLKNVLPSIKGLSVKSTKIIAMCKPQFEAEQGQTSNGVVKNSSTRRKILSDFESWLKANNFIIQSKADSDVAGEKGNIERFYRLIKH